MKLSLDKYAHLDSPIHRWEQRSKLVALTSLIFAIAFIEKLVLLPAAIAATITLYALSRLPLSFLVQRLRYPGLFVASVVILLPFVSGETVWLQVAGLSIYLEGGYAVLLIVTRFLCIFTISLVLFGTAPFFSSIKAMRSLGLPSVLADMTLLAYRYLETFGETLTTMQRAMRVRGWERRRLSGRQLRLLSSLAGSLIVRSFEQSQRVYQAMILRGYGQAASLAPVSGEGDRLSIVAFSITMAIALALFGFDLFG